MLFMSKVVSKQLPLNNYCDIQVSEVISQNSFSNFDKLEEDQYSYSSFYDSYLLANRPCILRLKTKKWDCFKWVLNKKPYFSLIDEIYGDANIPVANCGEKYYNSQKKDVMKMNEYISYWKKYCENNYPDSMPCLYLKDWHFTRDFPEDKIYTVPKVFASDWLNEYFSSLTEDKDDYRFVYMGPKGTWTPLHCDVFTSFSWSVNICGRKRWLLFPPGEEDCLRDNLGQLVYDAKSAQLEDCLQFPKYKQLQKCFDVIQEPGEAIFVPSGWHHQVWNVEDTISINHNWINACNIDKMWLSLKSNLDAVEKEIADCREMEHWGEHCQVMLKATYGMDYKDFYSFISYIAKIRLQCLFNNADLIVYGGWQMGKNQMRFDLVKLHQTLVKWLHDYEHNFPWLSDILKEEPFELSNEIENYLLDS